MKRIGVSLRLRPIRFAFLVRPNKDNKSNIQRIFEINTCLWGGMYNPIIPYFELIPSWWSRDRRYWQKSSQIIEGYLNFFEPDFIIEAEEGLGKKLDLPEDIIVNIKDFHFDESYPGYKEIRGVNVFGIYKKLYHKEYKFVRRHKHEIIMVQVEKERFKLFTSCIFGAFPIEKSLSYIEKGYKDAFDPEVISLDSKKLEKIYNKPYGCPLDIGCEDIDIFHSDRTDPMIFILDVTQPRDLIDFWNLRAYKRRVLAIPLQWIDSLSEFCKNFVVRNYKPLPGNPHGVMIQPTFLFSRSLKEEKVEKIKPYLSVKKKGAVSLQYWYPSFWEKKPDIVWSPNRPVLTAKVKSIETTVVDDKGNIRFGILSPDFVGRYHGAYCWANVVHLGDSEYRDEIATVFPTSLRNPNFPKLSSINERVLSNTEGLVCYLRNRNSEEYWKVLDGLSAFIDWFKTQKIEANISDAGKTLLQVIRSFQGFWGVSYISYPIIIERLNAMACKLSKITEDTDNDKQKEYLGRTVEFNALKAEIHEMDQINDAWKTKLLESLLKYNVIKLGLEVKCSICEHRNWYAIDSLRYELTCENCITKFSFPEENPSNRKINWCYRVIGPFSKPDYAQGAYTSALALRFFKELDSGLSSSLTWSTSLNMKFESGKNTEADFILWYQRKRIIENDYGVELVFGESKSFANDSFEENDVKNMKDLALEFPGSILVFATMKSQLSQGEKSKISTLAKWGRGNTPSGLTRAPVIILTATELFSQTGLGFKYIWKEKGGRRAKLIEPAYVRTDNLRVLADLTQQVYLNLPSYHKWLDEKWEIKKARRRNRKLKEKRKTKTSE